MGKLLHLPMKPHIPHYSIPEFEPSSDEVGAMLISGDFPEPICIILSPLKRTRKDEWNDELEFKWFLSVREIMKEYCQLRFNKEHETREEFLASFHAMILLWDPIFLEKTETERVIMGGTIEIIWPGVLTGDFANLKMTPLGVF